MSTGVFTLAAALVLDREGRALLVRKEGTRAFMQPGGKIEPGESAREAIVRELAEELTLHVDPESLSHVGRFFSAAANEPGWTVDCEVFALVTDEPVAAASEIAEARWFDPADPGDAIVAPLTLEHVFPAALAGAGRGQAPMDEAPADVADPVVTDPVVTDPAVTDPVVTDPAVLMASLSAMPEGLVVTDVDERIVAVNDAVCRMTGFSREELVGRTCGLLQGPDTQPKLIESMHRAVLERTTFTGEVLNYRKDGTPFWNGLSIAPVWRDGELTHFVSVQRDITDFVAERISIDNEHATAELMLGVARALSGPTTGRDVAQIIADSVPSVWGSDRSTVLFWDEVEGRFVMAAISGWAGALAEQAALWEGTREDSPDLAAIMDSGEPALLTRSNSEWAAQLIETFDFNGLGIAPIQVSGRVLGIIGGHWAITPPPTALDGTLKNRMLGLAALAGVALDQARLREAITWGASHDPVTGLANWRVLEEHVQHELDDLARRGGDQVVLVACSVNRFSRISDTYPVAAVDSVLWEIGDRLVHALGRDAFVARLGADDFAVVARGGNDLAETIVGHIEESFSAPFVIEGEAIYIDVTMGGTASTDLALNDESAEGSSGAPAARRLVSLAKADLASRRTADPRERIIDPDEVRLDADLRSAVANGEIVVHYQPQVAVADGALVGVEALVRWNHPTLGQISPIRFIPLAEYNGTIREIGRHVLETACADAARWRAAGHPLDMSVNAAVHQLEDPTFIDTVLHTLQRTGLPPERLTLEVTESRVVSDRSVAQAQLRRLCDLGVRISVDDFGTGFSSLTQLTNTPVGELKVDRSFTARITGDGRQMVAGVLGLARGLGLAVVAEGVEHEAQLDVLRELGCERAQGYHIARPMPGAELERDWLGGAGG